MNATRQRSERDIRWQWWDTIGRNGKDGPVPEVAWLRDRTLQRLIWAWYYGFGAGVLLAGAIAIVFATR